MDWLTSKPVARFVSDSWVSCRLYMHLASSHDIDSHTRLIRIRWWSWSCAMYIAASCSILILIACVMHWPPPGLNQQYTQLHRVAAAADALSALSPCQQRSRQMLIRSYYIRSTTDSGYVWSLFVYVCVRSVCCGRICTEFSEFTHFGPTWKRLLKI